MGRKRVTDLLMLALLTPVIASCSNLKPSPTDPAFAGLGGPGDPYITRLGGNEGLFTFGGNNRRDSAGGAGGAGIGVNAFLWRGALDTLSFLPLSSADPFGGVIITDWYSPADAVGERFKATAYILGRELRSDGLRISLFRQVNRGGRWVDAEVSPVVQADIENRILDKARRLREQAASNG